MAINTFGALRKTRGSFYHSNRHPNILTLDLFIAFFVCRIHNCSISPKLLIVLAKTYGTQKIENHDKTIVTYKETKIIEGRYIRCSTSYIRNRRSIHTSLNELHTSLNDLHTLLNELHTSSKVDTKVFFSVSTDTISRTNASGKICTPSELKSHKTDSGSEFTYNKHNASASRKSGTAVHPMLISF